MKPADQLFDLVPDLVRNRRLRNVQRSGPFDHIVPAGELTQLQIGVLDEPGGSVLLIGVTGPVALFPNQFCRSVEPTARGMGDIDFALQAGVQAESADPYSSLMIRKAPNATRSAVAARA